MNGSVVWIAAGAESLPRGLPKLDRVDQNALYKLGADLQPLAGVGPKPDKYQFGILVIGLRGAMARVLQTDAWPRLSIARAAAVSFSASLDKLWYESFANPETGKIDKEKLDQDTLDGQLVSDINQAYRRFETLLSADLERSATFAVPRRGIYDTEELVNAAQSSVPSSLVPFVPSMSLDEVSSAGRCLAFGLFTAAGFHMCRAIESLLEAYYFQFSGSTKTLRSWHDYIKELEKLAASGASPAPELTTIAYIDQLRQSSRNPIMHPRVLLDEADAMMIFDLGKGVMLKMAQELKAARASAKAGPVLVTSAGTP